MSEATYRIVVYDDDPQQLPMRRHVIRVAQRDAGALAGPYADAEVVGCTFRREVLEAIEGARHSIAFVDLESRTGDMSGARLIRTLADDPALSARVDVVAMTAHNSFEILAAFGRDVVAVLQTTSEDLGTDAAEALTHAADPDRAGRRAFPRAQTPGSVQELVGVRFHEHFGFDPRPGDLLVAGNLAQGVPDSVTNHELQSIDGARSAVAHFKRAVKEARGVPVDLVAPLAISFLRGVVRESLDEPVRAGTIELAASVVGDPEVAELARLSEQDLQLVLRTARVWEQEMEQLDARDQAGRQLRVQPTLKLACPDEAERARLLVALHVLADVASEPVPARLTRRRTSPESP